MPIQDTRAVKYGTNAISTPILDYCAVWWDDVLGTSVQKNDSLGKPGLFKSLFQTFPHTLTIRSENLPRLKWRDLSPQWSRKAVNNRIICFTCLVRDIKISTSGRILKNSITNDTFGLFRTKDGCHLSDVGCELFLNSLLGAIEAFLTSDILIFLKPLGIGDQLPALC